MSVATQIRFTITPKYKDFNKGQLGRIIRPLVESPYTTANIYLVETQNKVVWCTSKEFEPWSQISLLN
jgi:hypothetical protein